MTTGNEGGLAMDNPIPALRRSMIWLGLVPVFIPSLVRADVTTYPAPAGEAITGDYAVTVNGKPVDVYAAQSEFFEGDYYFATFDFSGKAAIRVTSSQSLAQAQVQPSRFNVRLERSSDREITLTAEAPFRISVERDGRKKPLLLFGNAPEIDAPRPGDPNVVYFAPGVHRPGKIMLTDDQTLYLAKERKRGQSQY